ncbi:Myotubularin-related protein 9 [Pitangus sulphuratus]|nr:Myotubularin-related protein 9 [Pitangus sulphuratus]
MTQVQFGRDAPEESRSISFMRDTPRVKGIEILLCGRLQQVPGTRLPSHRNPPSYLGQPRRPGGGQRRQGSSRVCQKGSQMEFLRPWGAALVSAVLAGTGCAQEPDLENRNGPHVPTGAWIWLPGAFEGDGKRMAWFACHHDIKLLPASNTVWFYPKCLLGVVLGLWFVGSLGTIVIKCKDLRIIQLDIPGMEECLNIASSIETDEWRLSCINKEFSVCPSYPPVVIVPKCITDEELRKVATFRHGNRFPVLSYYHKKNGMIMMRSSQPLTGTNGRRCKEDEKLINASLRPGKRGYIIDTRSLNVAQQARAKGGGFEQEVHYPQWRRIHKGIERFNILQESLIKLVEACNDQSHNMDRWLSKLEASNWLTHVKEILTTACLAAQCIDREGASVLVHGTEGTDSTLQVTSLAQIILDPRCRTIRGFESLVVREWLQAGHPFQQRCAQSAYSNSKQKWEAPVFLLFLDCVWQILRQFPCSFEFNEQFLIMLFEHAYASQFGTFLGNNESERAKLKLPQKTMSLWSWVNRKEELTKFQNPIYEANSLVIWPAVAPQSLQLWAGVFLRWNRPSQYLEEAQEEMIKIIKYNKELQDKVKVLRRHLAEIEAAERAQGNL